MPYADRGSMPFALCSMPIAAVSPAQPIPREKIEIIERLYIVEDMTSLKEPGIAYMCPILAPRIPF